MSSWENWIKCYIWDDQRTPYFVSPERMTVRQADYEIFAYVVLLFSLFLVVLLASVAKPIVAFYALSMLGAAVALGITKHPAAAAYCATAPIAAALHLALGGLQRDYGLVDHLVIIALIALWAAYGFRVIGIARSYDDMRQR